MPRGSYAAYSRKGRDLAVMLKAAKDSKVRAVIQSAYDAGHRDGYMQALEEVI